MLFDRLHLALQQSYAHNTWRNFKSQYRRYTSFAKHKGFQAFPISESSLILFATFLSMEVKSVDTIRNYVSGVRTINSILSFESRPPVELLNVILRGLRRLLAKPVKQAPPLTPALLISIGQQVNITNPLEVSSFTALLFGFHLLLRRSNLVPETRSQFDQDKQLTRSDVVHGYGRVSLVSISWTKTIQYKERVLELPLL